MSLKHIFETSMIKSKKQEVPSKRGTNLIYVLTEKNYWNIGLGASIIENKIDAYYRSG